MSLYVSIGLFILLFISKGEVERFINSFHTPFLDQLFLIVTMLGDGIFLAIIIFILFLNKIYHGLLGGICFLTSTVMVQSIKRFAFPDSPRPLRFFEPNIPLHYVDGLEIHSYFSFPSGHTSGAFTMFCLLAILMKNKKMGIVFFFLGFSVGLSRMYLLQHFFIDTYFGAIFGTTATLITYSIIQYKTSLSNNSRLDKPVYKLI